MKKKFYIFLCMLVGVILLLIIQRSALALYIILSDTYFSYELIGEMQMQLLNMATIAMAVLIGLVYGNYLGHHWYPLVYGEDGSRVKEPKEKITDMGEVTKTVTIKPVRAVDAKVKLKSEVKDKAWDFDDLLKHDAPAVDSLSSSAPTISSAVSLGQSTTVKTSKPKIGTRKTVDKKNIASKKVITKSSTKTPIKSSTKTTTKTSAKATVKKAVKPAPKKVVTK